MHLTELLKQCSLGLDIPPEIVDSLIEDKKAKWEEIRARAEATKQMKAKEKAESDLLKERKILRDAAVRDREVKRKHEKQLEVKKWLERKNAQLAEKQKIIDEIVSKRLKKVALPEKPMKIVTRTLNRSLVEDQVIVPCKPASDIPVQHLQIDRHEHIHEGAVLEKSFMRKVEQESVELFKIMHSARGDLVKKPVLPVNLKVPLKAQFNMYIA